MSMQLSLTEKEAALFAALQAEFEKGATTDRPAKSQPHDLGK